MDLLRSFRRAARFQVCTQQAFSDPDAPGPNFDSSAAFGFSLVGLPVQLDATLREAHPPQDPVALMDVIWCNDVMATTSSLSFSGLVLQAQRVHSLASPSL